MTPGGSKKKSNKVANRLVAASGAAVLAVYTAGYSRTQSAANLLATQVAERRAAVPATERATIHVPQLGSPVPIPARLLPAAPPLPQQTLPAPSTTQVEEERAPAVTNAVVKFPESIAEPPHSEVPEPPALLAQVSAVVTTPVPLPSPPALPAKPTWKDGTYLGWGTSRHGDIQAAVLITAGRIESATIAQCRTRYSCSVIETLPPEVAQRQGPDVDTVSGATQSADAFYYAVVNALKQAK
jgi:uncharacterized protein with FMN-binding domain